MIQIHQIYQTDRPEGLVTIYVHGATSPNHLIISTIANGEVSLWKQVAFVKIDKIKGFAFISPQFILDLERYNKILESYGI